MKSLVNFIGEGLKLGSSKISNVNNELAKSIFTLVTGRKTIASAQSSFFLLIEKDKYDPKLAQKLYNYIEDNINRFSKIEKLESTDPKFWEDDGVISKTGLKVKKYEGKKFSDDVQEFVVPECFSFSIKDNKVYLTWKFGESPKNKFCMRYDLVIYLS